MTTLHNVVLQTLHRIEQRLEVEEYKFSLGSSNYVFSLSTLDEINDFDRGLYKKSNRNKVDALLACSIGDNVGNYIPSLMSKLPRQVMLEVNYAGAHGKFAFRRTALHDFPVGVSPMFFNLFDKRLGASTTSLQCKEKVQCWSYH
ncbi:hypothetical protein FGIG_03878 [Fasciola gigantica]|uniref:Uncharacterized protein n=1 Tax=Fasciola gigantica TaxID=46835 RepID=A0A504YUS9_FASGI|nr:hypothetical protein FGIG_03878 [Fasciola gigantica]